MTEERQALLRAMAGQFGTDAVLVYNPQWHKENYRYLTGLNYIGPMVVTLYLKRNDCFYVLYSSAWDLQVNAPRLGDSCRTALIGPDMAEPAGILKQAGAESVAISGGKYLPFLMDKAIRAAGVTPTAADGYLEKARLRKTPREIAYLEEAVHLSESGWQVFMQGVADGLNEYQIAARVEYHLKKNGTEDNFLLMATGGKEIRGMTPPMNRTAKPGDMVRTEITPQYKGYWAQICRTCVKGRASEDQLKAFSIFLESTEAGIAAIRPGVNIRDVARAENDVFRRHGYGEYCTERYTRGRGHGHGLDLDEQPLISESTDLLLEEGMVIVVHPNTYNPLCGYMVFGDPVEVTADGCRVLSRTERKLFEV
ncbi:MAG: aminopeptidase P family protein [Oscillospiraceae bacterium]|nr:aminopeptidase P family protein [Oscillospiraceae bacterium]